MGIFSRKKAVTIESIIAGWLDGAVGGNIATPYSKVPAVYKAVKALIDNVSMAKYDLVSKDDVVNSPEIEKLLNNPYYGYTFSSFLQALAGYYALYGEAFILKGVETEGQRKGTQLPKFLLPINPNTIQARTTETDSGTLHVGWKINNKKYELDDIIHIKDFNPDDSIRGVSPVKVLAEEISSRYNASSYNNHFFANNATPNLVLETEKTMNKQQTVDLTNSWNAKHKGAKNSGKFAVLSGGLKAKLLGGSHKDIDFVELTKSLDEAIVGMWRVPKAMFGYTDGLNYATFQGQLKVFWTMTIIPMLNRIQDDLNKNLVTTYNPKIRLAFNYDNVEALQENINEKVDAAVKLQTLGFTRNEINDKLELGFEENGDWGDQYLVPFSLVPAGGITLADTQGSEKGLKKKELINGLEYTQKQVSTLRQFNKVHDKLSASYRSAVNKFFQGQKKRVLDSIDNNKSVNISINWEAEDDLFSGAVKDPATIAINDGVRMGDSLTGLSHSQYIDLSLNAATRQRLDFVSNEVNNTTKDIINKTIANGVAEGKSDVAVKDDIKKYFNRASNRAATIARTEVAAQLNEGLLIQYNDVGVKEKEWVTNLDGYERDSHAAIHGEIVRLNQNFSNGLMNPGGFGDPAETIGCRCMVFPVEVTSV